MDGEEGIVAGVLMVRWSSSLLLPGMYEMGLWADIFVVLVNRRWYGVSETHRNCLREDYTRIWWW